MKELFNQLWYQILNTFQSTLEWTGSNFAYFGKCLLNVSGGYFLSQMKTRPNRSTRSEDYTQMTTLLNRNEHDDSIWFFRPKGSLELAL